MKQYDIYSIGNALVDIDFKVTPELLAKHGIEKGVMTLIDSDRSEYLLNTFGDDSEAKACAGSAANTTILLSQLGGKAYYSGRVGNDEMGDVFCNALKNRGVSTNIPDSNRQHGSTGTCLVMVTPDTDRTMNTHLGVAGSFTKKDLDEHAIAQTEYFYIEGYLIPSDSGFEAALKGCELAKKHGTKIVLTLSDRNLVKAFKDRFLEVLKHDIDMIFCNDLEAQAFSDHHDTREASQMLQAHCKQFVVTLGPKGAHVFDGNNFFDSPAYDVPPIDSVGAGDTFAGGFLYALTHGFTFEKAAEIANFASGLVVGKYGPRLDEDEIEKIKNKINELK